MLQNALQRIQFLILTDTKNYNLHTNPTHAMLYATQQYCLDWLSYYRCKRKNTQNSLELYQLKKEIELIGVLIKYLKIEVKKAQRMRI